MSEIQTLLPQASEIRDATTEHENTALRVGTMFVDLITATSDELDAEAAARESDRETLRTLVRAANDSASLAKKAADNAQASADKAQRTGEEAGKAAASANAAALSAQETADTAQAAAGNAQQNADAADEKAGTAQATADAARAVADSALPKAVDVSDLDTMGTDGSIMAMRGLVVDAAHTRYCVTATSGQRARTVGYLDIMTDSLQHVLTQVLTTHYTFTPEGVLDSTSHTDSRIRTYFRSYGLSSGTVGDGSVPSLAWTSWREMVPETVAPVEVESEERLNAMLEAGELEDGRMYFVAEEE